MRRERSAPRSILTVPKRLPPARACQRRTALVDDDARQPRRETLALLVVTKCPEGAQERVLERFLGVLAVADDPQCDSRAAVVMPIDEVRIRLDVAVEHPVDVREIAHAVHNNLPHGRFRHTRVAGSIQGPVAGRFPARAQAE